MGHISSSHPFQQHVSRCAKQWLCCCQCKKERLQGKVENHPLLDVTLNFFLKFNQFVSFFLKNIQNGDEWTRPTKKQKKSCLLLLLSEVSLYLIACTHGLCHLICKHIQMASKQRLVVPGIVTHIDVCLTILLRKQGNAI